MSEWRVHCEVCGYDQTFPTQESASRMTVYHNALWEGEHDAIKEEV